MKERHPRMLAAIYDARHGGVDKRKINKFEEAEELSSRLYYFEFGTGHRIWTGVWGLAEKGIKTKTSLVFA